MLWSYDMLNTTHFIMVTTLLLYINHDQLQLAHLYNGISDWNIYIFFV